MKKRIFVLTIIFISILLYTHNVPKTLTTEDKQTIEAFLKRNKLKEDKASVFEDQMEQIKSIQRNLLTELNCLTSIPENQSREPKDLFDNGCGGCYDKSRTLEKMFHYLGYPTRHISVFKKEENTSKLKAFFTKAWPSHAALEVKTEKGWLTVDPVFTWVAETSQGDVMDMKEIQDGINTHWNEAVPEEIAHHYNGQTFRIIGLYSRHGRFYKPFDFVPDFNLKELMTN